MIHNALGFECGPRNPWVNAPFAWYVTFYVCWLPIAPIVLRLCSTKYAVVDVLVYAVVTFAWAGMTTNDNFMYPLSFAIAGVLAAKYNWLNWLGALMARCNVVVPLAILVAAIVVRDKSWGLSRGLWLMLESTLTILWIVCCLTVIKKAESRFNRVGRCLASILMFLGALSMPMWFLHGLFFTQLPLQWLLYAPRLSVLVLLWGVLLIVPPSMGVMWLQGKIWKK